MNIMTRMGFGSKWCRWVEAYLKSSSVSIIVNGSPSKEFEVEKGVRQGDPLSPFLFILAAEGLNAIMIEAVEKENAKALMSILRCFEEVLGLRVNFNNSKLYG
ncbi:reverse transcriptase domain, reverse transcriptase zinc-binding domain protein, partial [Tanacetum coccineum]